MARPAQPQATIRRQHNQETSTFVVTFRDPRRWQDPLDHTKGRKVVRKSLKTTDRAHAENLSLHLNRILADASLWRVPPADTPSVIREIWLGERADVGEEIDGENVRVAAAPGVTREIAVETDVEAIDPDGKGIVFDPKKLRKLRTLPVKVFQGDYNPKDKSKSFALAYRQTLAEVELLRKEREALGLRVRDLETENKALRHKLRLYNKRAERSAKVGPLKDELQTYIDHYSAKKITRKRKGILRVTLQRFIEEVGQDRKADDVTEAEVSRYVDAYRAKNGKPISEERRKEIRAQVCTFLEAVTHQSFSRRAVGRVAGHKISRERKKVVWLEFKEAQCLVEQMYKLHGDYWGDLATVQVFMGWRPSELLLLQKANVSDGAIELDPVVDADTGVSHAKTGGRTIKIPGAAVEAVQRRVDTSSGSLLFPAQHKLTKSGEPYRRKDGRTGLLAEAWNEDLFHKRFTDKLREAAAKAEIKKPIDGRTLRRTFGSIAIRSGFTIEQVARVMGDRPQTIRKHYARLEAEEVDLSGLKLAAPA